MKFRIAVLLSIFCITLFSVQVQAQTERVVRTNGMQSDPAKVAQIRHLLTVIGVQERMPQMMRAMTDQLLAMTDATSRPGESAPSPQVVQYTSLLRERMIAKMSALDLVALYIPVYDNHYSADDITALVAFYESPVGQKTLQLQTQLAVESMQAVTPVIQKLMRESVAEIQKEHPEFDFANDSHPAIGEIHGGVVGGVIAGSSTYTPPPPPPPPAHAGGSQVTRITKGGDVAAATAIKKVPPVYPELARQAQVQGTVRLRTLIDTDGRVIEVAYVSGPALLVQAATDAVKQWLFKPTVLNGVPVQVECVLEMNFALGR